ncbi:MAG: alpha-amylase/4-alpha-glucanotransferase domain-containing protein [Candidatus Hodarchaeales archaeon]
MSKVYFPIAFHAHQPLDNFDWVIEEIYNKSYQPLLEAIERHEKIKVDFHFSGALLEWLTKHKPDYLESVAKLVKTNRISILGGGFYEPILSMIPEIDRHKQLTFMMDWWQDNFNIKTYGAWLAERVWEPSLAETLHDASIEFIMIDDNHVRSAGYSDEQLLSTFITEDQGKELIVVPISEKIRYLTPWKPVTESKNYLKSAFESSIDPLVVSFDDAEKMGAWPGQDGGKNTYKICYQEGFTGRPWIDEYFELPIQNSSWIETCHIREYLKSFPPKGLVYMPSSSYDKMGVWSLHTDSRRNLENLHRRLRTDEFSPNDTKNLKQFLKGSFWRNFLIKYPEVNQMHKRMLYSHTLLQDAKKNYEDPKLEESHIEILKAQSNDGYWHGMFAGLYYRFIRDSIYNHLLKADKLREEVEKKDIKIEIKTEQILKHGEPQIVVNSKYYMTFFDPQFGGVLYELDDKLQCYNWLNTLASYPESYHPLDQDFSYDKYPKHALRTSVFFKNNSNVNELGKFSQGAYLSSVNKSLMSLERIETITINKKEVNFKITKVIEFQIRKINWEINVTLDKIFLDGKLEILVEIPIFLDSMTPIKSGNDEIELKGKHAIKNLPNQTELTCFEPKHNSKINLIINDGKIVIIPLFTQSKGESGWEKQYQGSNITITKPVLENRTEIKGSVEFGL